MAAVTEVFITSIVQRNTNAQQELLGGCHNFQWRAASHGIIGNPVSFVSELRCDANATPLQSISTTSHR
jgi:hypothetical protein